MNKKCEINKKCQKCKKYPEIVNYNNYRGGYF